jgi:hypothetical protein
MSQEKRLPSNKPVSIGTGPFLAKVVGHLDPAFMGGLEVSILKPDGNILGEPGQTFPVGYAPPFYGSTAFEFMGLNPTDYNDTQKSYGMWFVPPDIGVTVIVIFIDGQSDRGYWTNCVPSRFMNSMIPAIAASEAVAFAEGQPDVYDVSSVPVAEINRRANDLGKSLLIDKIPRPVHPIADRYLQQGTLEDEVRGSTKSTVRRQIPNSVSGILTPGPADRLGKKDFIGKMRSKSPVPVPVSRLGGTQFVMDDGDPQFQRKKSPSDGPPEYIDIINQEEIPEVDNVPKDEYVRLRTRTGHQILLHNSEDLIYIGNSRGTSWVELTSDGKIDIFAEDSISIHSKQDLNIYADRDVNIEAGRNINMKASAEYSKADPADEKGKIKDKNEFESGRIQIESAFNTNLLVGANLKIQTQTYLDADEAEQDGFLEIAVNGYTKIETGFGANSPHTCEILTSGSTNITSLLNNNILGTIGNFITAGATNAFLAATHLETAAIIHMNGPPALPATPAFGPADVDEDTIIKPLETYENPVVDPVKFPWKAERYQRDIPLLSILRRIPQHEPWSLHEHLGPLDVKPGKTDREGDHPPEEE